MTRRPSLFEWFRSSALSIALGASLVSPTAAGDAPRALEYELKAVFLYKLTHFVVWPSESFVDDESEFVIGILGDDPFGPALPDVLEGREIAGRKPVIRRFSSVEDLGFCHLLFISSSARDQTCSALAELEGVPSLAIGDFEDFARWGGTLALAMEDNRIRLLLNRHAYESGSLGISSRLLNLVRTVEPSKCE